MASKLDTLSTRDMVEALIVGERDPRRLADLARGRMKAKRSELITALDGRFDDHHAELARLLLGQIDALSAQIGALSARIEQLIAAMDESDHHTGDRTAPTHAATASGGDSDTATVIEPTRLTAVERLDEITGVGQRAAQTIIAEIGLDMTASPHRSTWCPGPTMPTHHPVRSGDPRRQDRQGQPLPEGSARRGRGGGPAPTPSWASATGAWSNAAASSKPSSR